MKEKLLPLGTIVYLKDATAKLMVVGRGATYVEEGKEKFSDYIGVVYPNGIDPEDALFFNHKDIDKVLFEGYIDEEEERYLEVYAEWEEEKIKEEQAQMMKENSFGF